MTGVSATESRQGAFQHEALLYANAEGFFAGTLPFIRDGVDQGEAVLVVVAGPKIDALQAALNGAADAVMFADMAEVGANPARIIPAWQTFLDRYGRRRPLRGIGEPVWPGRDAVELVECQRHEALLNVAFAESGSWRLLCPYDTSALPLDVIDEAERSHPFVLENGVRRPSASCRDLESMAAPCGVPLSPPPSDRVEIAFAIGSLHEVRERAAAAAERAGLGPDGAREFSLAAHEVAANSVRHGGGEGVFLLWQGDDSMICEIRDQGAVHDPLVGRREPSTAASSGRGLWIANQMCDLVQLRSPDGGTQVRLYKKLPATAS